MVATAVQERPKVGDKRSGENTLATRKDLDKLCRKMMRHGPGSGLVIRHARHV